MNLNLAVEVSKKETMVKNAKVRRDNRRRLTKSLKLLGKDTFEVRV